jgi:Spx/MgsR family transcriptional regulator
VDLTVYHLKTCDTCRKAIKALKAAGHELTLIDVRADGVSADALDTLIGSVGFEALLNTRSTTWRGLDDSDKSDVDASKAISLMGQHPTLIKRPVITDGDKITVGWKADAQSVWGA